MLSGLCLFEESKWTFRRHVIRHRPGSLAAPPSVSATPAISPTANMISSVVAMANPRFEVVECTKIKNYMQNSADPFTGTWNFDARRSRLSTPLPRKWVQLIVATRDELVVRESIVRSDGSKAEVSVAAKFDGSDYPVYGFPLADFMAYRRVDDHSISGTGRKNGVVVLTETVSVTPDGRVLTLVYSVQNGAAPVARGLAVFDKDAAALPR
jgi:hypothetical protein